MIKYLNEAGLGKILALGGGLAGAALGAHDLMQDLPNDEAMHNYSSMTNTGSDAIGIPMKAIEGATAGGATGLALNGILNSNKNNQTNTVGNTNTTNNPGGNFSNNSKSYVNVNGIH